jgi:hypothetical protein
MAERARQEPGYDVLRRIDVADACGGRGHCAGPGNTSWHTPPLPREPLPGGDAALPGAAGRRRLTQALITYKLLQMPGFFRGSAATEKSR